MHLKAALCEISSVEVKNAITFQALPYPKTFSIIEQLVGSFEIQTLSRAQIH